MTVKEKLGQLIMFGFPGRVPDAETEELIGEYKAGNVILFSHNIENMEQTRWLCALLREKILNAVSVEPIISIDQEGGVVSRLPGEAAAFPSAMAVAATGDERNAYLAGLYTGRELNWLGINCNLAPVADLNVNNGNPVIGVRSYGKSADGAIPFILSAVRGQTDAGILSVVKHFPGHGDTEVDSHLGLPCIAKGKEALSECELIPFRRAIEAGVPVVMAAHILYPALDNTGVPASMSEKILQGLLRRELGFEGVIFSDCMEMKAIQDHFGTPEGFVRSIIAGVDLGCISHTPAQAIRALRLAEQAVEDGRLTMERLDEAVSRVLACKERLAGIGVGDERKSHAGIDGEDERKSHAGIGGGDGRKGFAGIDGGEGKEMPGAEAVWTEARRAASDMMQKAIVRVDGLKLPRVDADTFFVGCHAYRSTFASDIKGGEAAFPQAMAERFGGSCLVTGVDPGKEEIERALARTREGQTVVVGTYNGHLNRGQVALVNALCDARRRVIAVALRNPYDLDLIRTEACKLAAFEYSELSFNAVERVLTGAEEATGVKCW